MTQSSRWCSGPLLAGILVLACRGGGEPAGAAQTDCAQRIARAAQARVDSLFVSPRGLLEDCPDAMVEALVVRWGQASTRPDYVHQLRGISSAIRDARLTRAIDEVARDPAVRVEARAEALSTLSYYLRRGRWLEFTFLKDPPDSASLRMFGGNLDDAEMWEGSRPIPAGYADALRATLGTIRETDSSAALRHAARRFLAVFDALMAPPAAPPPGGSQ